MKNGSEKPTSKRFNDRILADSGVTLISPENTWIEFPARIGQDTIIEPFTWIGAGAEIPPGSHVKAGSVITNPKNAKERS